MTMEIILDWMMQVRQLTSSPGKLAQLALLLTRGTNLKPICLAAA
jgi:hypothetical protein